MIAERDKKPKGLLHPAAEMIVERDKKPKVCSTAEADSVSSKLACSTLWRKQHRE
jgi:hypothetical protein